MLIGFRIGLYLFFPILISLFFDICYNISPGFSNSYHKIIPSSITYQLIAKLRFTKVALAPVLKIMNAC